MGATGTYAITHTPPGLGHARACLPKIAQLARAGAHTFAVRDLAVRITRDVGSKDTRGIIAAVYRWVRDNIRYRHDPIEMELLQTPERTLEWGAGDCAAYAILFGALLQSLGIRVRYRTVGRTSQAQEHVQAQAWDGSEWVDVDPVLEPPQYDTRPRADLGRFGEQAPGADHFWNQEGVMLAGPRRKFVQVEAHRRRFPTLGELEARPFTVQALPPSPMDRQLWPNTFLEGPRRKFVHVEAHRRGYPQLGEVLSPQSRQASLWYAPLTYPALPPSPIDRQLWPRTFLEGPRTGRRRYVQVEAHRRRFPTLGDLPAMGKPAPAAELKPFAWVYDGKKGTPTAAQIEAHWASLNKDAKENRAVAYAYVNAFKKQKPGGSLAEYAAGAKKLLDKLGPVGRSMMRDKLYGRKRGLAKAVSSVGKAVGSVVKEVAGAGSVVGKVLFPVAAVATAASKSSAVQALPIVGEVAKAHTSAVKAAGQLQKGNAGAALKTVAKAAAAYSGTGKALQSLPAAAKLVQSVKLPATTIPAAQLKATAAQIVKALPSGTKRRLALELTALTKNFSLSGLGFRPTISFSLGATTQSELAAKAVADVQAFIRRASQPPQIKVASVATFQGAVPGLKVDGLWGPNTRAAAAHYLGKPAASMPAVAKPWAKQAVTWAPPSSSAPAAPKPVAVAAPVASAPAAPKPVAVAPVASAPAAPKPVAVAPVASAPAAKPVPWNQTPALKAAAKKCVDAVKAFIKKNKRAPGVKLAEVRAYQEAFKAAAIKNAKPGAEASAKAVLADFVDGLWGPDTREMAAATLGVQASSLPPSAYDKAAAVTPAPAVVVSPSGQALTPIAPPAVTPAPAVVVSPSGQALTPIAPPAVTPAPAVVVGPSGQALTPIAPPAVTPPAPKRPFENAPLEVEGELIDPWAPPPTPVVIGPSGQELTPVPAPVVVPSRPADLIDPWAPRPTKKESSAWLYFALAYLYTRSRN